MRRPQTGYANGGSSLHHRNTVEEENEALVDGLKAKISNLKTISIDIGHEVKYQNRMLGEMEDEFEGGEGLLKGALSRVVRLASAGHNRHLLYLALFAVFVFLVIWIIMKF